MHTTMTTREIGALGSRFERIVRACGLKARKKTIATEFCRDVERYQAPGRFYHTLTHIKGMLDLIDEHEKAFKQPWLVRFAAVKHDVIYNVHHTRDNETYSALDATGAGIMLGMQERDRTTVAKFIMATEHLGNKTRALSEDEKLFADIDLDGFSRSWDTVLGNSRKVRREFAHLSDKEFADGNSTFLARLEMRGFIYQSPLYKKCETRARDNISNIRREMESSIVIARPTNKVFA
jgi:predicted metal-dependent HD superfamily phosphohydrolase